MSINSIQRLIEAHGSSFQANSKAKTSFTPRLLFETVKPAKIDNSMQIHQFLTLLQQQKLTYLTSHLFTLTQNFRSELVKQAQKPLN